jgi:MoaE-MoaD fusion protein
VLQPPIVPIFAKPGRWYIEFMVVRVLFFGSLKEIAGKPVQECELPPGAAASVLWEQLRKTYPAFQKYERAVAIAVNHEYAKPDRQLQDGDEVGFLPPVSGGSHDAQSETVSLPLESPHARIQEERIDLPAITEQLKRGEDGAVATFDGIVRNNTRGRKTLYLDYESYAAMAIEEMERLAVRALSDYAVRDVRLVHRLGRLQIGETSVLIVVASAHRGAAFDACRFLIENLKKSVPIWKKEYFEDGAMWADGEPFPPEVKTV